MRPSTVVPLTTPLMPPLMPSVSAETISSESRSWQGWCRGKFVTVIKLGASIATTAISTAVRVMNYMSVTNALSSIGIGMGVQSTINTLFPQRSVSRMQQFSLTVCGQTSVFFLTYVSDNYPSLEPACVSGIGVMLGVNLAVYGKHFIDKYFNRIDADPPRNENAIRFYQRLPTFIPEPIAYSFRGIAIATCAAGYLTVKSNSDNPVAEGFFSFATLFYLSQGISQFLSLKIDDRINRQRENLLRPGDEITKLPMTRWRVIKGTINSIAPIAIPLFWVPWTGNAQTMQRVEQMWFVGLATGFFDGFLWKSQETRFKNKAINDLDELKDRPFNNRAIRVGRIAYAALVHAGLLAIVMKETSSTDDPIDKAAIGTMYAGFMLSTFKNLVINASWNLKERLDQPNPGWCTKFKDRWVIQQMQPRVLGMAPIYMYLFMTNAIAMHSGQPFQDESNRALYYIAWGFYGLAMENEFHQTWGEKKGIVHRVPNMAVLSGILMTIKEMKGELS